MEVLENGGLQKGCRASSDWTAVGKKRPQSLVVGDYVVHDTHNFAYLEDLAPNFTVTKNGRGLSSFNAVLLVELLVRDENSCEIHGWLALCLTFCR